MGYYSNINGSMGLSRILTHGEIRAIEDAHQPVWFELDVWEEEEETDTGRRCWKESDGIVLVSDEGGKTYHALEELQKLVALLPEDVTVSGQFVRTGEQAPDISRYVPTPDGRSVIEQTPVLRWPDGSEEPVRR